MTKLKIRLTVILFFVVIKICAVTAPYLNPLQYQIPYLKNIKIDGNINDWKNKGTQIQLLADYMGVKQYDTDFSASFKLSWNKTSLCVMVSVVDDTLFSFKKNSDAVEFFVIDKIGGKNKIQYVITPDFNSKKNLINTVSWDFRGSRKVAGTNCQINSVVKITDNGYIIEAEIPFKYLDVVPKLKENIGFEITVTDADNQNAKVKTLAWNYLKDAYLSNFALNKLVLSNKAEKIDCSVNAYILDHDSAHIVLNCTKKLQGKKLTIKDNSTLYFSGILNSDTHTTTFPLSSWDGSNISVSLENKLINTVNLNLTNREFKLQRAKQHEDYINLLLFNHKQNPKSNIPVLFIGHSMFRYWACFEEDMKGFDAINVAFGGSKSNQVLDRFEQLVLPYKPKAIVYFEGSNDYFSGVKPEQFIGNVKAFAEKVNTNLPGTKLFIISPDIRNEFPEYNKLVKEMVDKHPSFMRYIDISDFKTRQGDKYDELLLPDHKHLNAKGYSILAPIILENIKDYMN